MLGSLFRIATFLVKFALISFFFYVLIWIWIIRLLISAE